MSLPINGTLPVTINNRYVLVAFRGGRTRTEFILPGNHGEVHKYRSEADRAGRFKSVSIESELLARRLSRQELC
jgi:hypothetical protein